MRNANQSKLIYKYVNLQLYLLSRIKLSHTQNKPRSINKVMLGSIQDIAPQWGK